MRAEAVALSPGLCRRLFPRPPFRGCLESSKEKKKPSLYCLGRRTEKIPWKCRLWLERAFRRNRNSARGYCRPFSQSWERSQGLSARLNQDIISTFSLDIVLTCFALQKVPVPQGTKSSCNPQEPCRGRILFSCVCPDFPLFLCDYGISVVCLIMYNGFRESVTVTINLPFCL